MWVVILRILMNQKKNNKRIFIIIKFDFEIFFIVVGKEKLDKEELDIKSV